MVPVERPVPKIKIISSLNFNPEPNVWNLVYDKNVHLFRFLTYIGLWSVHRNKNGFFEFKFMSFSACYTIFFQILLTATSYYVTPKLMKTVLSGELGFVNSILFSSILSYAAINLVPILAFCEGPKIAAYLNDWDRYQVFHETSLKKLQCKPKASRIFPFFLFASSILLLATLFSLTHERYLKIFEDYHNDNWLLFYLCTGLFSYSILSLICYICIWFLITNTLKSCARTLISELENEINDPKIVEHHRHLWLLLRNLTQKLGLTYGMTYLCIIFLFYVIGLPITYVAVIMIIQGDFTHLGAPFQMFGGITLLSHLSQRAIDMLTNNFEDCLAELLTHERAERSKKELATFLETVAGTPVSIPLKGFFNLDRGINVPLYSSVITFLIIIVQFREEKPVC